MIFLPNIPSIIEESHIIQTSPSATLSLKQESMFLGTVIELLGVEQMYPP